MTPRTDQEKARRKEAHRLSMVASGGVFVLMALAAGYVLLSRSGMPSFLLSRKPAAPPPPRVALPTKVHGLVAWTPWGPEVVARAQAAGKPILLSVRARWSYASRLMEARAYSDPKIAALIAERFVAAEADAETRPDAARRYLAGGWPTTAVLLPNGQILDSATYMEPAVLERWLTALADGWDKGRARAEASAAKSLEERAKASEPKTPRPQAVAERALAELRAGEGAGPRFPRWRRWRLLKTLEPQLAAERLKDALVLEDAEAGGFFRYAAGPGWTNAEPEKTLADQAEAVRALAGVDDAAARRAAQYALRSDDGALLGPSAALAAALLESGLSEKTARRSLDRLWSARRRGDVFAKGLLDDSLAMLDALLAAGRLELAARAALGAERAFMDERSGALFDRVAPGELPEPLDRLLDPALNFEAWRLYGRLAERLAPGDPRRERLRARAAALAPWLLARAAWLDPAERLMLATAAQRDLQP